MYFLVQWCVWLMSQCIRPNGQALFIIQAELRWIFSEFLRTKRKRKFSFFQIKFFQWLPEESFLKTFSFSISRPKMWILRDFIRTSWVMTLNLFRKKFPRTDCPWKVDILMNIFERQVGQNFLGLLNMNHWRVFLDEFLRIELYTWIFRNI